MTGPYCSVAAERNWPSNTLYLIRKTHADSQNMDFWMTALSAGALCAAIVVFCQCCTYALLLDSLDRIG